jgi:hypothetical protein|tara:strand:+ start:144 stop:662 length:519 start_codon:yes stop_codon:yes gene_type:complete
MGKRSDFERKPRDFYPTPFAAVEPLIQHIPQGFAFAEPCAGDGQLCRHLEYFGGTCMWASDIEPQLEGVLKNDYTEIGEMEVLESQYIITNPPWDRSLLHPMIEHFTRLRPTWLLFDADWAHTKQSAPYMKKCAEIVSVGRIKWFGNMTGKDNCAWYLFYDNEVETTFHGRT